MSISQCWKSAVVLGAIGLSCILPGIAHAQTPPHPAGIRVELAWMADPYLCPFHPIAFVQGKDLVVGGYLPSKAYRNLAIKLAQKNCKLKIVDRIKIHPGLRVRSKHVSSGDFIRNAAVILRQRFPNSYKNWQIGIAGPGQISVRGKADSLIQQLAVSQYLRQIPGCRCVRNEMVLSPSQKVFQQEVFRKEVPLAPVANQTGKRFEKQPKIKLGPQIQPINQFDKSSKGFEPKKNTVAKKQSWLDTKTSGTKHTSNKPPVRFPNVQRTMPQTRVVSPYNTKRNNMAIGPQQNPGKKLNLGKTPVPYTPIGQKQTSPGNRFPQQNQNPLDKRAKSFKRSGYNPIRKRIPKQVWPTPFQPNRGNPPKRGIPKKTSRANPRVKPSIKQWVSNQPKVKKALQGSSPNMWSQIKKVEAKKVVSLKQPVRKGTIEKTKIPVAVSKPKIRNNPETKPQVSQLPNKLKIDFGANKPLPEPTLPEMVKSNSGKGTLNSRKNPDLPRIPEISSKDLERKNKMANLPRNIHKPQPESPLQRVKGKKKVPLPRVTDIPDLQFPKTDWPKPIEETLPDPFLTVKKKPEVKVEKEKVVSKKMVAEQKPLPKNTMGIEQVPSPVSNKKADPKTNVQTKKKPKSRELIIELPETQVVMRKPAPKRELIIEKRDSKANKNQLPEPVIRKQASKQPTRKLVFEKVENNQSNSSFEERPFAQLEEKKPAGPPAAAKIPQTLLSPELLRLKKMILRVCKLNQEQLELEAKGKKKLLVRFYAQNRQEAYSLAQIIMNLPELAPFRLDLEAKVRKGSSGN